MIKQWLRQVKYKKMLLFILILFLMGFLFGIVYYAKQDEVIRETLLSSIANLHTDLANSRTNNILTHSLISLGIIILSFTVIGIPLIYFYLFFEGLSIGFSFSIIVSVFGFKGILFCFLYFLFYKLLFLVFIIFLIMRSSRISRNMLGFLFYKNSHDLKNNILVNLRKVVVIFFILFLFDIGIYFVSAMLNNVLIYFL